MSQWYANDGGGEFNSGGGASGVQSQVTHSGTHAAFLRINNVNGDQGVRLFRWQESQRHKELYYSAWYYFPRRFSTIGGWWNISQYKSKTSTKNDAFFILNVGNRSNGDMHFYLYDWQAKRSYQQAHNIPVGQWVHIETYYRSSGDQTGQIIMWQDGVEVFNVNNVQTRYPDGDTQWSVNNYTSAISPDPATIYVDDAVISTTRIGTGMDAVASHP
jgi:hypothetical protein